MIWRLSLILTHGGKLKVEKVISMLSTCVFPDRIAQYPFDESAVHLGPPHPSNEGYAYAKRMLEVHSRLLHEESQAQAGGDQSTRSEFLTVVPTNVFGPFDNFHLEDGHVFPALVHRALLSRGMIVSFAFLNLLLWG